MGITVYIWPDGTWCSSEETGDLAALLNYKSDDYATVDVVDWEEDGTPASSYFTDLGIYNYDGA